MSVFLCDPSINDLPAELLSVISNDSRDAGLVAVISALLSACREIGTVMRDGGYSQELAGSQNTSGDHQLVVDLQTDEVIFKTLKLTNLVHVAASEENPVELACGGVGYSGLYFNLSFGD
jgi:fructose-1,6-bisphosphatase